MSPSLASFLTFLASACVLVLEIAAGRVLAPYVGVSLTTYTGIIGVILAGIALGAWLGGRLADERPPRTLVGPTLVLGGLAAMASVPIVDTVGPAAPAGDLGTIVVLSLVGFIAPATVLSAVGPMIVRASIRDVGTSGTTVGRLSAIGTAGAITGTFLTGFVLLGLVPTRPLILATGGLLVLVGVLVTLALGRRAPGAPLAALAAVALTGGASLTGTPCDRESAYYCIHVETDPTDPTSRTLFLDDLRHSDVDLEDPTELEFGYIRWFGYAAGPLTQDGEFDALHVGGGGLSFPRSLLALHPSSAHTILELDPAVYATAVAELDFVPSDATDVVFGDARLSIARQPTDGFDLVVGDAFGSLSVPWHLATREFALELDRVLRPDGRYVMNVIDGPALRFARAELATLRSVFAHVAVAGSAVGDDGIGAGNLVLIASQAPIDAADLLARADAGGDGSTTRVIAGEAAVDAFIGDAIILTDDFAPVDQLIGR